MREEMLSYWGTYTLEEQHNNSHGAGKTINLD